MYVGQTLLESLYKYSEKYAFLKIFQYLRLRKRFWGTFIINQHVSNLFCAAMHCITISLENTFEFTKGLTFF